MKKKTYQAIGALLGLLAFYLINAFIQADLDWIAMMYNGEGTEQVERVMCFIFWFTCCVSGAVFGEARYYNNQR